MFFSLVLRFLSSNWSWAFSLKFFGKQDGQSPGSGQKCKNYCHAWHNISGTKCPSCSCLSDFSILLPLAFYFSFLKPHPFLMIVQKDYLRPTKKPIHADKLNYTEARLQMFYLLFLESHWLALAIIIIHSSCPWRNMEINLIYYPPDIWNRRKYKSSR